MLNRSKIRPKLSGRAKLAVIACTLCLLIPIAAMRLRAQDKSRALSGTIYDVSGAAVAGATVTLRDQAGKLVAMTQSDPAGKFSFKALLSGVYEMDAVKAGFEPYKLSHISLPSSTRSSEEIRLRVAEVSEEMDVTAEKPEKSAAMEPAVSPNRVHLGGALEAANCLRESSRPTQRRRWPQGSKVRFCSMLLLAWTGILCRLR